MNIINLTEVDIYVRSIKDGREIAIMFASSGESASLGFRFSIEAPIKVNDRKMFIREVKYLLPALPLPTPDTYYIVSDEIFTALAVNGPRKDLCIPAYYDLIANAYECLVFAPGHNLKFMNE